MIGHIDAGTAETPIFLLLPFVSDEHLERVRHDAGPFLVEVGTPAEVFPLIRAKEEAQAKLAHARSLRNWDLKAAKDVVVPCSATAEAVDGVLSEAQQCNGSARFAP
jgi:hypothetical protein